MSSAFSSCFLLQIQGYPKSILTIWGKHGLHANVIFFNLGSFLNSYINMVVWFFYALSRRELLHSYGFEHMATLNNLEKAGLFKKQEAKSNWQMIKNTLQLVVEDTNTAKYSFSWFDLDHKF